MSSHRNNAGVKIKLGKTVAGILLPFLSMFGLLGNCLSAVVLREDGLDIKVGFYTSQSRYNLSYS